MKLFYETARQSLAQYEEEQYRGRTTITLSFAGNIHGHKWEALATSMLDGLEKNNIRVLTDIEALYTTTALDEPKTRPVKGLKLAHSLKDLETDEQTFTSVTFCVDPSKAVSVKNFVRRAVDNMPIPGLTDRATSPASRRAFAYSL